MKSPESGRRWAYFGAALGGAVSIGANVAHSYVPPEGVPADWSPDMGAIVGAVFWPVALFAAVEILARVAWPAGRRWVALRFAGLLPVAMVAAGVSYLHLSGLLTWYGEDRLTSTVGPLAVDGLMIMATGALLATGARRDVGQPAAEVAAVSPSPAQPAAEPVDQAEPASSAAPSRAGTRPGARPRVRSGASPKKASGGRKPASGGKVGRMHERWLAGMAEGREPTPAELDRLVGSSGLAKQYVGKWKAAWAADMALSAEAAQLGDQVKAGSDEAA